MKLFTVVKHAGSESSPRRSRALPPAGGADATGRFINKAWVSLTLVLVISGCAVGPDYQTPQTRLTAFHNQPAGGVSLKPATVALDRWWEGFNDPMLVTVVQRAMKQNLDVAAALARLEQARAVAQAAGAELYPSADLQASAAAQRQSLVSPLGAMAQNFPGYRRSQQEYTGGALASWEIDLAGGLRRNAAAARAEVEAAQADNAGVRISVAADAADAYLQIRGYQARLAVAQDQIDTDARLLALVEARRQFGGGDERENAQAEALLKQATASVPPLRIALEAQLNRLDVLMGAQPGAYASALATPASIPDAPSAVHADGPLDVLRRRPDVIAAERRLAASNERIGAALADYYPSVSLAGLVGFDGTGSHSLFSSQAFQPMATGGLRWRLFDFGRVDAEVAQAKGANAESLAHYRQSILHAAQDVENALMAFSQTQAQADELQGEVSALTRARDLSEQAYKAGSITLTDVLDADRLLLAARDNHYEARANGSRAAVALYRALGGGWDPVAQGRSKVGP